MPPVEFEPTILADKRPQTYTLDRAATETGKGSVSTAQKAKLHLNERTISSIVFSKVINLSFQIHLTL